eukprot:m.15214 g.15214  ORF g.15214 m.15214 type:complete len:218 (+) comp3241_c0_seq1:75-728(+)
MAGAGPPPLWTPARAHEDLVSVPTELLLDRLNQGHVRLQDRTAALREAQAARLSSEEHAMMIKLLRSSTDLSNARKSLEGEQCRDDSDTVEWRVGDGVNRIDYIFEALAHKVREAEEACALAEADLEARSFTGQDPASDALLRQLADVIKENTKVGSVLQRENMSRLEAELAMHKETNARLLEAKTQLQRFIVELEEELEAMQGLVMAEEHHEHDQS